MKDLRLSEWFYIPPYSWKSKGVSEEHVDPSSMLKIKTAINQHEADIKQRKPNFWQGTVSPVCCVLQASFFLVLLFETEDGYFRPKRRLILNELRGVTVQKLELVRDRDSWREWPPAPTNRGLEENLVTQKQVFFLLHIYLQKLVTHFDSIHATSPAHLVLDFIIPTTVGEEYKL
jgi:hypothetical protein